MAHYADAARTAANVFAPVGPANGIRTLDRLIWSLIAGVAVVVVPAPLAGFTILWDSYAIPGGAVAAMLLVVWFYRTRRPEERIASAVEGTAQLAAFAAVGAPLSYLAARFALPLQDHLFDGIDKALGFDWSALLAWMNAHRGVHAILNAAYMSFAPQATITVCVLAFSGRVIRLRVFLLGFVLTALATIAISAVLPAQGVWTHYGLRVDAASILPISSTSWPVFQGLRDGSLLQLKAAGSEGIITFPSLHAALGLIFAFALWPVPVLRWFSLALNMMMIVATPIDGSHYLIDVIVGLLIAVLCWLWAGKIAERAVRRA
jgi:membrane-associated phospholipid phosphatase